MVYKLYSHIGSIFMQNRNFSITIPFKATFKDLHSRSLVRKLREGNIFVSWTTLDLSKQNCNFRRIHRYLASDKPWKRKTAEFFQVHRCLMCFLLFIGHCLLVFILSFTLSNLCIWVLKPEGPRHTRHFMSAEILSSAAQLQEKYIWEGLL